MEDGEGKCYRRLMGHLAASPYSFPRVYLCSTFFEARNKEKRKPSLLRFHLLIVFIFLEAITIYKALFLPSYF